jgi:chitinase
MSTIATACTYVQVQAGNGCWDLAQQCNITEYQLLQYNPTPNLCSTIQVGDYVCCSAGFLPDFSPQPYSNGNCYTYTVQSDDTCDAIAAANRMSADTINNVNSQTWGWTGCTGLQAGQRICLSEGTPPFPLPVPSAECGPQVSLSPFSGRDSFVA